jgi:hypothetical protein
MHEAKQMKPRWSVSLSVGLLIASASIITAAGQDHTGAPDAVPNLETCPPNNSSIALFTRQAFDEGRESEGREYGKFVQQLASISVSGYTDDDIVEKSITVSRDFANKMRARGHDIRLGDLIVHRETRLNWSLSHNSLLGPIARVQLELQMVVIREMKRRICQQ